MKRKEIRKLVGELEKLLDGKGLIMNCRLNHTNIDLGDEKEIDDHGFLFNCLINYDKKIPQNIKMGRKWVK